MPLHTNRMQNVRHLGFDLHEYLSYSTEFASSDCCVFDQLKRSFYIRFQRRGVTEAVET